MRKFKVLKCKTTVKQPERRTGRDSDGNVYSYVVYCEKGEKEGFFPGAYGVEKIKVGQIIELNAHLAEKAANNPDFEEVFLVEAPKKVSKKKSKKKVA